MSRGADGLAPRAGGDRPGQSPDHAGGVLALLAQDGEPVVAEPGGGRSLVRLGAQGSGDLSLQRRGGLLAKQVAGVCQPAHFDHGQFQLLAGGLGRVHQRAGDGLEALATQKAVAGPGGLGRGGGEDGAGDPALVFGQATGGEGHGPAGLTGDAHHQRGAAGAVLQPAEQGVEHRPVGLDHQVAPAAADEALLVRAQRRLGGAEGQQDHAPGLDLEQHVGVGEGEAEQAAGGDGQGGLPRRFNAPWPG